MTPFVDVAGPGPWARFDDLAAGTVTAFPAAGRVVTAERPDEVVAALREVERATDSGQWAFGFVAYEAAAGLDPGLAVHPAPADLPLVWFGLTDGPVPARPLEADDADDADDAADYAASWRPEWTPQEHRRGVEHVRARIAAGDTYQCNLTVRAHGRVTGDPFGLYRDLALRQRGAHNAYLDLGRFVVASASPELFFERTGDELLLRPMKGTAARGRDGAEDRERATALRTSAKERAENVMIVDLIRNDVARVAETGGVRVRELCRVERYETVLQMTSDVTASLIPGTGLTALFRTLFPSGSVTGAPKASTMAILRDLEPTPRGVYCGAIGFVAPPDAPVRARFNVAIRTAVVDRRTGAAVYGVGGGITWGSEPAAEHEEVLAKTAILRHRHREPELVETMRYSPERGLRNRDRHLRRLAESAEYLGFRHDPSTVVKELAVHLAGHGPCRVRLRLRRDGGVTVDVSALPPPANGPVVLVVDPEPVDLRSPWLRHKTTLRDVYDGRARRHPDADEVVLVNGAGELTEVTRANLALRIDGRWWTPPLSSGCLPGVERARLLDRRRLHERVLRTADLDRAEAIAVLSSLRGWRPATLR